MRIGSGAALLLLAGCGAPGTAPDGGGQPAQARRPDAAAIAAAPPAAVNVAVPVPVKGGCRAARSPSFPSIAAVEGAFWIAYYEPTRTVVSDADSARGLEVSRPSTLSAAPSAGPALRAQGAGALLATVEAAGQGDRLVVRRVERDLAGLGEATEIAPKVDARYTAGLVSLDDGFVIGWIDTSTGSGRAMARALDRDGRPRGPAVLLSPEGSQAGGLALAVDGAGVLAAWIDPRLGFSPLYVARGTSAAVFEPARTVLPTGSVTGVPFVTVAAGADGAGLLAWGHMGPLGQDYLSRALFARAGPPPRSTPVSRVDAYTTLRAAVLGTPDGWTLAWDEPTATGRWPATAVRWQRLAADGSPLGEPQTIGPGQGVTGVGAGPRLEIAYRRGASICVAELRDGGQDHGS